MSVFYTNHCRLPIRDYSYAGLLPKVKQQICDMAANGSGIRDTARVLGVSQKTVIETLKKSPELKAVNEAVLATLEPTQTLVRLCLAQGEDLENSYHQSSHNAQMIQILDN